MGCSDEAAREAWQKRVRDDAYEKSVDPECGEMTVGVLANRYADASTGEQLSNPLANSLKDVRKAKAEREDALRENLRNRLQSQQLGGLFAQHADFLGVYDKGDDLLQEPEKPANPSKRGSGGSRDADTQEALDLELKVGHLKGNASKSIDQLCNSGLAAVVDGCRAIRDVERLCAGHPEEHPLEVFAAPKDTVMKRLLALWIALGQVPGDMEALLRQRRLRR